MPDHKFCSACGAELLPAAEICPKCGVRQMAPGASPDASDRRILPAFLLAFFVGVFGAHRFYVGKTGTAIVMLVLTITVIGMIATGIWSVVDWILIVTGNFRDGDGKRIEQWT
jgi:TM2 domain-containing membrane protein YozV